MNPKSSDAIESARIERLDRLADRLLPLLTKYILHQPTTPQTLFLSLDCREAFYGGAAGGGKSDALLMAALQYVDQPGYAALLLRRSYAELTRAGALIARADEWLRGTDAVWNGSQHLWRFPSGATLQFGYLENDADRFHYQSAEFQYIGFDELSEFTEVQYTFLFSRLRRLKGSAIPLRMRSASNPGGRGHEWVKRRFLIEGKQRGRVFVPAKLTDNPYLDQQAYRRSLQELDPVTRAQLLNGDWAVTAQGTIFRRSWFRDFTEPSQLNSVVLSWDTAFKEGEENDWSCCEVWGETQNGFYLLDVWRGRVAYPELKRQAIALDAKWKPEIVLIEDKASGQSLIQELQRDTAIPLRAVKVDQDKLSRAHAITALAEAGRVFLPKQAPWLADFLDEVSAFPLGPHDDQVDTMTQALSYFRGAPGILDYMRHRSQEATGTEQDEDTFQDDVDRESDYLMEIYEHGDEAMVGRGQAEPRLSERERRELQEWGVTSDSGWVPAGFRRPGGA